MPPLPTLSGMETAKVFESLGWQVARQRGSHIIMVKQGFVATLSIPDHRQIAKGTLRSLIRSAELSVDDFVIAMKNK